MKEKKYNCGRCVNRRICEIGMGEQPDGPDCPDYIPEEPRIQEYMYG